MKRSLKKRKNSLKDNSLKNKYYKFAERLLNIIQKGNFLQEPYYDTLDIKFIDTTARPARPARMNSRLPTNKKEFLKYAKKFYDKYHKNKKWKLISSDISSGISYLPAKPREVIAKGNCFENELSIINLYQVINSGVETYRFGTPTNKRNLKNPSNIYYDLRNFISGNNDNRTIVCISLLFPCTTTLCGIAKVFAPTSSIKTTLTEHKIIQGLKEVSSENNKFIEISFPMTKNTENFVYGNGVSNIFTNEIIPYSKINPIFHSKEVNDKFNEEIFMSIVNMIKVYCDNRERYLLCYHCKSSKDRSGTFDSIVQSTIFYYMKTKKIDYEEIRKLAKQFLIFSLLISFYSTGCIGLKLKNVMLADYIVGDDINWFIGDSGKYK